MARTKRRSGRGTRRPPSGLTKGTGSSAPSVLPAPPPVPGPADASGRAGPLAAHPIVTTSWGWRIGAVAVLVALGLCLTFLLDGKTVYGVLWAVVTLAWGFFVFKLHQRHEDYVRSL